MCGSEYLRHTIEITKMVGSCAWVGPFKTVTAVSIICSGITAKIGIDSHMVYVLNLEKSFRRIIFCGL